MNQKGLGALTLLIFVFSLFAMVSTVRLEQAYAKPPDWAPAHGYRRKHGDDGNKERKQKANSPYYWTFLGIDTNGDGRISLQEWNGDKALFIILDQNHNGYISHTEYARIDEERGLISGLVASIKEKASGLWNWLF